MDYFHLLTAFDCLSGNKFLETFFSNDNGRSKDTISMSLSVLQVIDRLEVGGAERVLVDLSNLLYNAGIQVEICTIVDAGPLSNEIHESIPFHILERSLRFNFKTARRLAKLAKAFNIIHVHSRQNLRYVWFCRYIGGFRTPIVFHEHSGEYKASRITKALMQRTPYIGISNQSREWAKNIIQPHRYYHLPNIIRTSLTDSGIDRSNYKNWVAVGNVQQQKNYEFILDLLTTSNASINSLTIFGKILDVKRFERLKTKADRQNAPIHWITDCTNVRSCLISDFRFGLHCAHWETGPLVLLEYMSAGLPFLAYDTGDVADRMRSHFPDLILKTFDINAWSERIKWLVNLSDKAYLELSQNLQEYFTNNYSEEQYIKECLKIYQNVLGS